MEISEILDWYRVALQNQLKPCPFCGGGEVVIHVHKEQNKESILCARCGARMERAFGVGVVQAWNCRAL